MTSTPSTNTTLRQRRGGDDNHNNHIKSTSSLTTTKEEEEQKLSTNSNGIPPYHTIMIYIGIVVVLIYNLPSINKIQEITKIENIILSKFHYWDTIISNNSSNSNTNDINYFIYILFTIRVCITIFIWIITFRMIVSKTGWYIYTPYLPSSKCNKNIPIHIIGIKTLYPYTSWCWIILGIYFTFVSIITYHGILIEQEYMNQNGLSTNIQYDKSYYYQQYNTKNQFLLTLTTIIWDIAASNTILVAFIIKYIMWPAAIRRGNPHTLHSFQNICMHNMNVLFGFIEYCIIGCTIPIRLSEWTIAPLYGCIYVLFSWCNMYNLHTTIFRTKNNNNNNTTTKNNTKNSTSTNYGPQFIYFFLDTTIEPNIICSIVLLLLLAVLTFFYYIYSQMYSILYNIDTNIVKPILLLHNNDNNDNESIYYFITHIIVVMILCSFVMRFRD